MPVPAVPVHTKPGSPSSFRVMDEGGGSGGVTDCAAKRREFPDPPPENNAQVMAAIGVHRITWPLLLLCVTGGRAGPAGEVPEPFNLTVNSYNLNTTLHWDYSGTEIAPYFCVDILDKLTKEWVRIETCQNISHHFCDLSHSLTDLLLYYKVRVKALAGSKTSNPATTEFSLSSIGIIGPPVLKVFIEKNMIVVDIFHPKMPTTNGIVDDEIYEYIVYHENYTKEVTDCDEHSCSTIFPILDEKTYCYSAVMVSNHFLGMVKKRSNETCIQIAGHSETPVGLIIAVVVGVLVILGIIGFIIARWTTARDLMPQSFTSIVRGIVYPHMSNQQTPKYDNVSTYPIDSPVDGITYIEEKGKMDTEGSADSGSKESSDPGYQSSLTENELKTDEREEDQVNSSSYFHTDSSTSGVTSTEPPESEKEAIPERAPDPPKPVTNSFGYDKPHVPKELI